jgi:hypothetical protein
MKPQSQTQQLSPQSKPKQKIRSSIMLSSPSLSPLPETGNGHQPTPPSVEVVDVYVKAIRSTALTSYYYEEKLYTVPDNEPRIKRHLISLLWMSRQPGFFDCQLEDGRTVTIHRLDLKMETTNSRQMDDETRRRVVADNVPKEPTR